MLNAKIITRRLMKNDRKEDILHSSGYAKAQSGRGIGAAGTDDFAARKALDSQRKYIQKYKNSRIMNNYYGPLRARTNEAQIEHKCGKPATISSRFDAFNISSRKR